MNLLHSDEVLSQDRLPFPNRFRARTVSLTPFLHFSSSSITEFGTHTSDLLGIICVAGRACVCENVLCGFLKWLLNQYLQHPFQTAGFVSISRPLFISPRLLILPKMPTLMPQSWLHSLGKRELPRQPPQEHPALCQPTLASEYTRTRTTADCKSVLDFFLFYQR